MRLQLHVGRQRRREVPTPRPNLAEGPDELVCRLRLEGVAVDASLERQRRVGRRAETGEDEDRGGRCRPAQLPRRSDAVELGAQTVRPGEHQVHHDDVGTLNRDQVQSCSSIGGLSDDPKAPPVERLGQHLPEHRVIVD